MRQRQWRSRQRVSLIILRSWVRSSLVELFVTVIQAGGEKQEPTKSSTKDSLTTVLFRNAASTYKAPITSLMHHKGQRQWRSRQRVKLIILRSWVRSSLVALFVTVLQAGGGKQEPTKSSTNDSLTTVLFRNAASTYKAPITSLMHNKGDSDNGAVGSA